MVALPSQQLPHLHIRGGKGEEEEEEEEAQNFFFSNFYIHKRVNLKNTCVKNRIAAIPTSAIKQQKKYDFIVMIYYIFQRVYSWVFFLIQVSTVIELNQRENDWNAVIIQSSGQRKKIVCMQMSQPELPITTIKIQY